MGIFPEIKALYMVGTSNQSVPEMAIDKMAENIIKLPGSAHESRITCDSHSQRRSVNAGDATTRDRFKKAPGWVVRTCLKYWGFLCGWASEILHHQFWMFESL